jgi:uncharacterized protein YkwD
MLVWHFGGGRGLGSMLLRVLAIGAAALTLLSACAAERELPPEPSFYRSLAAGGELDPAAAASMISGYRANNGLTAVTIDPALMKLAEEQARAMAARDKLDHNVTKNFSDRLRVSGYPARNAAENISAGYHTLAEAFSGWRDSKPHRENMLLNPASRIGIAAVQAPKSKYKVYWALIIAEPGERRG